MSFERYCNKCSRPFESENAYRSHLKHSSRHNACDICWRDFKSVHGRRGHMTSSVHQARDVQCQTCSRRFKSVADWASHVEPSYSHQQILRIVRHLKSLVNGLDWLTPIEDVDDEEVEDFHRFEDGSGSYKCPSCDKRFTNLKGLTQHLNSAVHRPASSRCMKCNFTSLPFSGMVRHLESESCGHLSKQQVKNESRPILGWFQCTNSKPVKRRSYYRVRSLNRL